MRSKRLRTEHYTTPYLRYRHVEWVEVVNAEDPIPTPLDVFEPFVTSKDRGIGLGLAIAKQIVLAHEGKIGYIWTAELTIFRIFLPKMQGK